MQRRTRRKEEVEVSRRLRKDYCLMMEVRNNLNLRTASLFEIIATPGEESKVAQADKNF